MAISRGVKVLAGRYQLLDSPLCSSAISQTWVAEDDDDQRYVVKLWPFRGEQPEDFQRALWDKELRTLYRVGSSPGADETILVTRDAGIDWVQGCFVVVMQLSGASGYAKLSTALQHRADHEWLTSRDVRGRVEIWRALQRIADGLRLLHTQDILHRQVGADSVFFDPQQGPRSARLGGFEWSVRLGAAHTASPPQDWSTPPEMSQPAPTGYRQETDWYGFGMLALRCFLPIEPMGSLDAGLRNQRALADLSRSAGKLSDRERDVLRRLIAAVPSERLSRGQDVRTEIQDIILALTVGVDPDKNERPLLLVINPTTEFAEHVVEAGFTPDPAKPTEPYNPRDLQHVARLKEFVRKDLLNSLLYVVNDQKTYILVGEQLCLIIYAYTETDRTTSRSTSTWDAAFAASVGELRRSEGVSELPPGRITVCTPSEMRTDRTLRQKAVSWQSVLPTFDRTARLTATLSRFHEFLRFTNQLELLIVDANVFPYEIVARDAGEDGFERIAIEERPRKRRPLSFIETEGGLIEYLFREKESGKPECSYVVLTREDEDALTIPWQEREERWEIESADGERSRVWLRRPSLGASRLPDPPAKGCIRGFGMFGQVSLIERRKRAIDRLQTHSYLLRSLSAPSQAYMDTGVLSLPVALPREQVDAAKQAVMQDILRVRPIYALQGPPGTGKTTLVAHLLRQLFQDDPVSQILITAQAHGAVDVLRRKVRDEAFRDVPEAGQPLAVRLGKKGVTWRREDGSIEDVSLRLLRTADVHLAQAGELTPVQAEWLQHVRHMVEAIESDAPAEGLLDFRELVRRGASLTYCTTSAGDLEELAADVQSFDWSIIEESGKAHGFDLALPLQAGHRWLLIGDHDQLPPYRFKDYVDGIDHLEDAVKALYSLPKRAGNLVDVDLLNSLQERSDEERGEFKKYARLWLNTFQRLFEYCKVARGGGEEVTSDAANGAAAGMLSRQYRMHPTIGTLISEAYYKGKLVNMTVDAQGQPRPEVLHPFDRPAGIASKAILWVDTPWAAVSPAARELGPKENKPRYTNPAEAAAIERLLASLQKPNQTAPGDKPLSLVVLSPYSQQVQYINRKLRKPVLPPGVVLRGGLREQLDGGGEAGSRLAFTVDSFQGNEADIVIVSLVRNNTMVQQAGLGFLEESPRLNVLLSRAERLLVLVGCWQFFEHQVSTVDLGDQHASLWHLKKVMQLLQQWETEGRVLRIPYDQLMAEGNTQ